MRIAILPAILLLSATLYAADPAWIEYGPTGAIARTIVTSGTCPSITIDGQASAMVVHSKPAEHYEVTVCEAPLPAGAQTALIGGTSLPAAKLGRATKVAILGDTGCRLKIDTDGKTEIQDCKDPKAWPFATIAQSIADWAPDVVLHVGDYYYREAKCKKGDCEKVAYDWKRWNEDFFTPAAPLLASTPWVFARGNHEECKRAAEGWFRFLDPRPYVWEDVKTCKSNWTFTPPYPVHLNGLDLAVFDSSAAKDSDAKQAATYAAQLGTLAKSPAGTWLVQHHPVWAIHGKDPVTETFWTAWEQAGTAVAPIGLVVTGHIHTLEALSFADGGAPQLVVGVGGTKLSKGAKKGVGMKIGPRTVSSLESDQDFGFIAATQTANGWMLDVRTKKGKSKAKCSLTKSGIVCD